nr:MAG TPA: CotH kinase protein [Caudoviricetes sp.]
MAKETVYNNTLVSGAADETLTYTRYVKDESSGKSTKELLDEKVNKTDQLGTTQIADKAVTTEKLENESVTTDKLNAASVTTDKVADANITTSKLADSSVETEKINNKAVTTDKLNDGAVDNSKLSPNAVTSEKIKDESIITEKLNDRAVTTEKVEEKAVTNAKLGDQSVDGRVVREASLETKHFANESVTTEKVARKSITKEKLADNAVDASQVVDGSIGNAKLSPDSVTTEKIKDGSVTNEKIADNTLCIGKFDPELRKTIQAATGLPDDLNQMIQDIDQSVKQLHEKDTDLQSQIDDKQQQITANDDDISLLQTRSTQMEEAIKGISASGGASQASAVTYENTESGLDSVTAQGAIDELASKKLNKKNIAQEFGDSDDKVVSQSALPFRFIQNEEFIYAVVDSEDRLIFAIYRDSGKPYFPLNEMYHVEQNEEFFAVWLDADDKVLLGIRRDGEIIGEIHAVNALKQVISHLQSDLAALQEKVGIIDTNLKELLNVFSLQDNEDYLAVEQDAEGNVLSATNPDGSHYIHNAKSETIPTEFEHIEDPEGRTEITTDAEDKILGYRDSEGTRHEHKISANHINLSDEAAKEVNEAFKSAGIKIDNPSDFSKDSHIELPIPRIAAQVKIYAPKLPTTKQDDIKAEIEYNDKDGNYFRKPVILNAQGSSSMAYYVKNMAIDIADGSEIKFGDFPTQDSFHLKKYYIDAFRGQCIVGYWLMEQVYKSRPIGQQYPYEQVIQNNSTVESFGDIKKDFFTGAKCHPDGFPIVITWIDNGGNETNMGVYTWNLKKSKEVYYADKKKAENIILDGSIYKGTLWGGTIHWESFEVRNPKKLKDIDENDYDGDNPKELSETDKLSKKVKDYITRWSGCKADIDANKTKETFEKYFLIDPFIDYYIVGQFLYHLDGFAKNWIWCTWDGLHWAPTLYDVDSIFGSHWNGTGVVPNSDTGGIFNWEVLGFHEVFDTEIKSRYKELRDLGVFSVENVMGLLNKWLSMVGYENLKEDLELYNQTPSYRASNINKENWELIRMQLVTQTEELYNESKSYSVGDICYIDGNNPVYVFKCIKECTGVPPFSKVYDKAPVYCGYYNSPTRVANWLTNRIKFLDSYYKYTV